MKKPLTVDLQIEYLKKNKKVVIQDDQRKKYEEYLLLNNYTNVVTPYKYKFHYIDDPRAYMKRYMTGIDYKSPATCEFPSVKEQGHHIYPNMTNIDEYIKYFDQEKDVCEKLLVKINRFERKFKAILSYYFLNFGNTSDDSTFFSSDQEVFDYIDNLRSDLLNNSIVVEGRGSRRLIDGLLEIASSIDEYGVYCGLDDMSWNSMQALYLTMNDSLRKKIFDELRNYNMDLGVSRVSDFEKKLFTLIGIRNTVVHGNSLEIHMRYHKRGQPSNNNLRTRSQREKIERVIKWLVEN